MIIMACSIYLTGCLRFATTVEIKKNGKANLSMIVAYQNGMGQDAMNDNDEDINKLKEQGWECETYNEDNYTGYKITKKNVDLKDLAKEMSSNETAEDMNVDKFQVTKHGSNYKVSWDIFGGDGSEDSQDMDEYSQYSSSLAAAGGYMKFVLKLPYKAKSSNATEVSEDGKTLTWDLMAMNQNDKIEAEFSLFNWGALIGGLIAAIVIIGGVVAFIVIYRNKQAAPAGFQGGGYAQNNMGGQPTNAYGQPTATNAYGQPANTNAYGQPTNAYAQTPVQSPNAYGQNPTQGYDASQGYNVNQGYSNQGYNSQGYSTQVQTYNAGPQQPNQTYYSGNPQPGQSYNTGTQQPYNAGPQQTYNQNPNTAQGSFNPNVNPAQYNQNAGYNNPNAFGQDPNQYNQNQFNQNQFNQDQYNQNPNQPQD